jgi:hypothetical protein
MPASSRGKTADKDHKPLIPGESKPDPLDVSGLGKTKEADGMRAAPWVSRCPVLGKTFLSPLSVTQTREDRADEDRRTKVGGTGIEFNGEN